MLRKLLILVKAIRFEHTALALSFALIATFVAANGWPCGHALARIFVATARAGTTAMAFGPAPRDTYHTILEILS